MKKKIKAEEENETIFIEPLLWIPGQRVSQRKIDDLKGYFPKPNIPLGEAWFIGESRELYDDLNKFGVTRVSAANTRRYLRELISGMVCFPMLPEWTQWFGYLFPRLIDDEGYFSALSGGLMALSLTSAEQSAAEFELNFAEILADWIMQPNFWRSGRYYPPYEGDYEQICSTPWGEPSVYGDISISMFLGWRYLNPKSICGWLHSVLAIEDVHWRIQVMMWFLKVRPIFAEGSASIEVLSDCRMDDLWPESYWWLRSSDSFAERDLWELVPSANIFALQEAIRAEFSESVYFEWVDQLAKQTRLWPQLELMMEQFQGAYLS